MPDPIRQYQQARRRRERALREATEAAAGVRYAAVLMEHWQTLEIRHPDFKGPESSTMPLEPGDWPTVERLVEVLSEWHRAERAVRLAWDAIPAADREGLRVPAA